MVIAMISSITVLVFFEVAENNKNSKIQKKLLSCPRCKNNNNLHDSNYCRIC
jgi:cytochrome c-type biogenesis protein CcmH/NrfF